MKRYIHEKNPVELFEDLSSSQKVTASEDSTWPWEKTDSKPVYDMDGFLTEYSLWHNTLTDEWVTIFGDTDLYDPTNSDPDMEFDTNQQEAEDWFMEYGTDYGEDEDLYAATDIRGGLFDFGKEEADKYGDLIAEKLKGKTVSKRKDKAEEPGGLIYEANELGMEDFWDLLKALEGMCSQGRAEEIDDSTYLVY